MSAIAGILVRRGGQPAGAADVRQMLDAMPHRGPDGNAHWTGADAVLGHALLRTSAEAEAGLAQAADGRLVIVASARLDEREELLARLGLRDRSLSDAALILRAYMRWGEECPQRLQGDFAFAIWDAEEHSLFCARDHFGVRPFYYCLSGSRFVFASEIGPVLLATGADPSPSEDHISGFLAGLPDAPQATPYASVARLPGRHCLTVTEDRLQVRAYWTIEPARMSVRKDAPEQFRQLFENAVRNRMRGTPEVGAMLSGGLDSSSIACVASRFGDGARKLPVFSLMFGSDAPMDEQPFIEAVLAQGRCAGEKIEVTDYAPFDGFDRVLEEQEGMFLAPGLTLTRSLYAAAQAKGVRVLLDGHGGDEVVSHGYGRLHELADDGKWLELWRQLHGVAATYGEGRLGLFRQFVGLYGPAWRIAKWRRLARRLLGGGLQRTASPAHPQWGGLINADLAARTGVADRFRRSGGMPRWVVASEAATHRWTLSNGLVSNAFEVLDKAAAHFGVEPRYPFWDKPLVEFCLALPAEEKMNRGYGRYVLRRAMQGILPAEVQWRRDKIDFKAALIGGMIGHHRGLIDNVLQADAERIAPYVDLGAVRLAYGRLLERSVGAGLADAQYVWRSVSLSLWLRQFQNAGAMR